MKFKPFGAWVAVFCSLIVGLRWLTAAPWWLEALWWTSNELMHSAARMFTLLALQQSWFDLVSAQGCARIVFHR
eukprot:5107230-Amphidinium_carterae.1